MQAFYHDRLSRKTQQNQKKTPFQVMLSRMIKHRFCYQYFPVESEEHLFNIVFKRQIQFVLLLIFLLLAISKPGNLHCYHINTFGKSKHFYTYSL